MRYYYITDEDYAKAESNGIKRVTLESRVRKYGWDVEKAVNTPIRIGKFSDKQLKLIKESVVNISTIKYRINHGWSFEDAISIPSYSLHTIKKYPDEVIQKAAANGISYSCFKQRVNKGWSIEEACNIRLGGKRNGS